VYTEDDLLPISALQHLSFCERQWGLIHLEGAWAENVLTAEGREMHGRAHEGADEWRDGVRVCRGLRLRSLRLGLTGQADVVEFHPVAVGAGVALQGYRGAWRPFPVEYKRGKSKPGECDRIQLCAQALCLEEMLEAQIPAGALFYGKTRRREDVEFHGELREATERLAARLHEMRDAGVTPPAVYEKKCERCSLVDICLPDVTGSGQSVEGYLRREVKRSLRESSG